MNVTHLCDQILDMQDYRAQLYDYLKNRMYAVAPNLTVLVGELIGARLISHAGICGAKSVEQLKNDLVLNKNLHFSILPFTSADGVAFCPQNIHLHLHVI